MCRLGCREICWRACWVVELEMAGQAKSRSGERSLTETPATPPCLSLLDGRSWGAEERELFLKLWGWWRAFGVQIPSPRPRVLGRNGQQSLNAGPVTVDVGSLNRIEQRVPRRWGCPMKKGKTQSIKKLTLKELCPSSDDLWPFFYCCGAGKYWSWFPIEPVILTELSVFHTPPYVRNRHRAKFTS